MAEVKDTDQDDKLKIKDGKLSDFRPQEDNANTHTQRGLKTLSDAYDKVGYVAPMTAAANGEVLDGNARLEQAFDQFDDEALVIHHSGNRPIIMIRDDVPDADDPMAKQISYSANRVAELDLNWDPEQLMIDREAGVDLSGLFSDNELSEMEEEALLSSELASSLMDGVSASSNRSFGDAKKQIKPVLYTDEIAVFEMAIKTVGIKNRGQALIQICKEYLNAQKGQFNIQT